MKCIFSWAQDGKPQRCDKEAEYIYLGKSYCNEHLEFHATEMNIKIDEQTKEIEKFKSNLVD